jgi:serine/threonine protein phosphatase 1
MLETIEVMRVKRFAANPVGRDFAVGDIHGHFTRLQVALDAAGFDPAADRLFSTGDLVDRGPECRDVLDWLAKPWFHPVRGNHDDYVCRFDTCDPENWIYNGGAWFAGLSWDEQREFAAQFRELPIAIEVETAGGLVGIVHADCVFDTWAEMRNQLESPQSKRQLRNLQNTCMWSRSRVENFDTAPVSDMRAVVVGHSPMKRPAVLGNVYHIDTGGWLPDRGYFTLLNLASLEPIPSTRPSLRLDWE